MVVQCHIAEAVYPIQWVAGQRWAAAVVADLESQDERMTVAVVKAEPKTRPLVHYLVAQVERGLVAGCLVARKHFAVTGEAAVAVAECIAVAEAVVEPVVVVQVVVESAVAAQVVVELVVAEQAVVELVAAAQAVVELVVAVQAVVVELVFVPEWEQLLVL